MRVLEIGCGPGALARAIAERIRPGHVLAIDRSAKAIALATAASQSEIEAGILAFRTAAVEGFTLEPGEAPCDLAVAIRVGALDGRHPRLEAAAITRIAAALVPHGPLFIDGGDPLKLIPLDAAKPKP